MSPEATTRVDTGASVHIDGWGWRHAGRRAWALNQITLDIRPGEHVLVLGASGSGKSTLLCGIAGVLGGDDEGESHGTLTVDGARPEQMRGSIGLVMQDPEAQVVLARAGDDVAFGCENLAVEREEIWQRVDQSLHIVDLNIPLDYPTSKLSGGQKQRLALASVLAMDPRLLLLDEPTANLDPQGVQQVRNATRAVLERTGATAIIIEHRVDVWMELIDRVIVVIDGAIGADGTVQEVLHDQAVYLRECGIWLPGDEEAVIGDSRRDVRNQHTDSIVSGSQDDPVATNTDAITVSDLTIGYDPVHPIRRDISMSIPQGKCTCIVGGNGLGKTTLALTMAGLLKPLDGKVRIDPALTAASDKTSAPGEGPEQTVSRRPECADPYEWRSRDLVGRLSMVFQEPEYQFVCRTVQEELELGPTLAKLKDDQRDELVKRFLKALKLEHLARANPMTLSGGEKRRLSVATALISAPDIVIADEPPFGQDRSTWVDLGALLRSVVDAGTTLVAITHDHSFVEAMADNVIDLSEVGTDARTDPASAGGSESTDGVDALGNEGHSCAHKRGALLKKVNPVTQVLGIAAMTTPLIASIDTVSAGIALICELLLLPLVGISAKQIAVRMIPVIIAAPLASVSMLLYADPGGTLYWHWGPMAISDRSIALAAGIFLRIIAVAMPAIVVFSHIDPTDMADGLGQILHLPARPVLASLAGVRMAGLMMADWKALMQARRMRGLGDANRFIAFFQGAFALLVFALRRSAKLSVTMEARGFGADTRRTWARPSTVSWADMVFMVLCIVIPVIALTTAIRFGCFESIGT